MKRGQGWLLLAALCGAATATGKAPDFSDDFEARTPGQVPGAPWKEETYQSGAVISVDSEHAFSGTQAMHILTPANALKRRGYMAIHLKVPLPQLQSGMYGRLMAWLDQAPEAPLVDVEHGAPTRDPPPVHWTLLQGEGRSADDRYNSIYRLGLMERGGTQLMANFETTPPVKTNCMQQSPRTLPVRRWACVEWHMVVATHELQFWIDGKPITHVKGRATTAQACAGHDLDDRWLAPQRFDSLYIGFERYGDTVNDQNLWIDDVALSASRRIGCPAKH
jgi:hypothetical protein